MSFISKLESTIDANHSLLCVGLDPREAYLPDGADIEERLAAWGIGMIEQTSDLVCCYKPNFAFFEQHGPAGLRALRRITSAVPQGIPVLLDAKRGDIGSTAQAYAAGAFEQWGADAVTLNPYLGADSIKPFLEYEGKAAFILCYTSNPSAAQMQQHGQPPLFEFVAENAQGWGTPEQICFVVGATQPEALARVRAICPRNWILVPGVGAQGGDLDEALRAGLRQDGAGLIVPVSRAVIGADDPRQAALELKERINQRVEALKAEQLKPFSLKDELVKGLYQSGCVKFGNFTLASGKQSPIYIDLRRVVSYPALFKLAARLYAGLIEELQFDHIAAVPYAALPFGSVVALNMNRSFIYPRKEVKGHGTGQAIEGAFEEGQKALSLEDVITSGGSILSAVETLRAAGLLVEDVAVLVDRQQGGDLKMKTAGLSLHAVVTIDEILDTLEENSLVEKNVIRAVKDYLDEEKNG
jgi:uridine monophosphate synthetase